MQSAVVTVGDPNAIDAPQTITVTVAVGGLLPDRIDLFAPVGGERVSTSIASLTDLTSSTQSGGQWLVVTENAAGSFRFARNFSVAAVPTGLTEGSYSGSITGDGRLVPVTLRVTSQPIASFPSALPFRLAANSRPQTISFPVTNAAGGTINVTGVTASSSPAWLTASAQPTGVVSVTANPSGLQPGVYETALTIASNAVNAAQTIPVRLEVIPAGPAFAYAGGAVNNATFESGDFLAPGDIVALFGEQFTTGEPQLASAVPLATELGGVRVLVNGTPAPLYYVSYGQINFQMPYEIPPGDAIIRVERAGQPGNAIAASLGARAPRILPGTVGSRWRRGDVIVMYAVGFGQTSPSVTTGAAAPSEPLARVEGFRARLGSSSPFGEGIDIIPDFVGLTPGFVGLYQVNVRVPENAPVGNGIDFTLFGPDSGTSNRLSVAID
jgi:uncharacterized protein (TIGR03437 family)